MLKVEKINVYYNELQALTDISFSIRKGEFLSLVGSNGAGKTTLLNTLIGLLHPRSGIISWGGERIDNLPPYRIVNLGISLVPENKWHFPQMSVYENLLMGAYAVKNKGAVKESLEKAYAYFPRLYERRHQLSRTLSGGELQMLIIARALMSNPQLLLVDELSLGLSPKLALESFALLSRLNKEQAISVILAEQNVFNALELADRGIVLENGRVAMLGPARELLKSEQIREKYLGI